MTGRWPVLSAAETIGWYPRPIILTSLARPIWFAGEICAA